MNISNDDELSMEQSETTPNINVNENFKGALLASLYSQIEFLRNELEEKKLFYLHFTNQGRRCVHPYFERLMRYNCDVMFQPS